MTTRILECPCGVILTGVDDEELFRLGRQHADEHHPDDSISDEFVREHVRANARDLPGVAAPGLVEHVGQQLGRRGVE